MGVAMLAMASASQVMAKMPEVLQAETGSDADTDFHDGPYVILNDARQKQAHWVCHRRLITTDVSIRLQRPKHCGALPQPTLFGPYAIDADHVSGVKTLVALSDVHGQYQVLKTLLKAHGVIDDTGNWALKDGHLVMTGDMFDRGPEVNEVLWFMYELDRAARAAGGMVHLLMGNHEQMVLQGDLRYVNDRYRISSALIGRPYDALYDRDTEIGQWLRSKNTLVKINDMLFMHGGVSPEWLERGLTITQANDLYRKHIDDEKATLKTDPLLNFLFYKGGPTWYRGYFKSELDESQIDALLKHFGVNHIVVGHTSQTRVLGLYDNRIIAIDSSIKLGNAGELLWVEGSTLLRGKYDGSKSPLISD